MKIRKFWIQCQKPTGEPFQSNRQQYIQNDTQHQDRKQHIDDHNIGNVKGG